VKLLVVDDDPDLLALVAFSLTNAGYAVVKAADTGEALRAFEAELPNLVILDINLPSGSGFDVCKAIRARSEVPVMMLTARGDEEDLVRALELGADDYLTKPFSPAAPASSRRTSSSRAASLWTSRPIRSRSAAARHFA
jgi:DNA-binding response OmpR family regulator